MSDTIKDLSKRYEKDVHGEPRDRGLSPIPEHPDLVEHGMWSAALSVLLTTLRFLAPATLQTFLQQSLLFRIFRGICSTVRAILFSSEAKKQEVLQWLSSVGPERIESLETIWHHGWVLCSVLDEALPGSCAGHPPSRLTLKHAQAIADNYLGIEPIFTQEEIESTEYLTRKQEWKLITYLIRVKEALSKIPPPVAQPSSQKATAEPTEFMMDYIAKGSGLKVAQVNNKMYFKIYPAAQQSLDPGEITILIRGPKDTYGMSVLPPLYGKAQEIRKKLLGLDTTTNYTENALPITQGARYLRSYGKIDLSKTFHIPQRNYDIEIEAKAKSDCLRIGYTVSLEGKYEIFITSKGEHIVGSPFSMTASNNIIADLERECYCLEDGEEIGMTDNCTDKKVVLRIVDFVTEKMLLRDDGSLEKISDDEAENLLTTTNNETDSVSDKDFRSCCANSRKTGKSNKFGKVAWNVNRMNRVCKVFEELTIERRLKAMKKEQSYNLSNKLIVPDIVNSTFNDSKNNSFYSSDNENSVTSKRRRSKSFGDVISQILDSPDMSKTVAEAQDSLEEYKMTESQEDQLRTVSSSSSSNPFENDYEENFEKDLRTFVKTEFETNNSQIEETSMPIKIVVEESSRASSPVTNPFIDIEDVIHMQRPKTPVLKIIKGEVNPREDSVYVDKHAELLEEELLANEFLNPFFSLHQNIIEDKTHITDFIIGAPVSLPPNLRANTPELEIDSLVVTSHPENATIEVIEDYTSNDDRSLDSNMFTDYSSPISCNTNKIPEKIKQEQPTSVSSTFHSISSSITDIDGPNNSNVSDNHETYGPIVPKSEKSASKKDMWDSAYVSIDETNSSPDNNNNDNVLNGSPNKSRLCSNHFSTMGPAEKDMWLTCEDLRNSTSNVSDDLKIPKTDPKEKITPIQEEINKQSSTPLHTKSIEKRSETKAAKSITDMKPVTFAELNTNLYVECLNPKFTPIKTPTVRANNNTNNEHKSQIERRESIDSASVVSDVKRYAKQLGGEISEVQPNVTESGSVSQTLHCVLNTPQLSLTDNDQYEYKNIVTNKKNYWDQRIRDIEAKAQKDENKEKKRRLTTRNLIQNDSLTKKRAKEVANKVIGPEDKKILKAKSIIMDKVTKEEPLHRDLSQIDETDSRLVEKWRRYWDTKLESHKDANETTCFKNKHTCFKSNHPKIIEESSTRSKSHLHDNSNCDNLIEVYKETRDNDVKIKSMDRIEETPSSVPEKQEEMQEEIFKAFETSPKRFFGTSRKQILNKIDSFLEKQSTADNTLTDASGASPDTGLVSSRISLFHTISKTEEPSWVRRKCQSMNNISQRKFSESSVSSNDNNDRGWKTKRMTQTKSSVPTTNQNEYENETKGINYVKENSEAHYTSDSEHIPLKQKRARLVQKVCKSFEGGFKEAHFRQPKVVKISPIKNAFNEISLQENSAPQPQSTLTKSSISKSEMDIFNKTTNKDDNDLDMHKSYDDLPKVNVKNLKSLYESAEEKAKSFRSQKHFESCSSLGAAKQNSTQHLYKQQTPTHVTQCQEPIKENWRNKSYESVSSSSVEPKSFDSNDIEINSTHPERDTTYVSFSDIELEIVENSNEQKAVNANEDQSTDYKSRFKLAKQYFQSLEELPPVKKPRKLNECEVLLIKSSTESLDYQPRKPRRSRKIQKSNSLPSSELSKIWSQLQDGNNKLIKISEKFNVEDLFSDVTEGKLSRQGSLRGIPHKKAVLEAFKSMKSLVPSKMSPYEMATTQLNDFAKENHVKNAQTYLSEYPYLPTTDPSKYQSRLDPVAHGLITLKELKQKRRRNSVPDLRLNTTFAVNL